MNSAPARCPDCGSGLSGGLCARCLIQAGMQDTPRSAGAGWVPPTLDELEGQFAPFEVVELLGHGAMGAVYKGWQASLDRYVAIKVLSPALPDEDPQFAARFCHEARTMAQFSHPGIVSVYDFGESPDGLWYIVMEFIEGVDLQRLIAREGYLPPKDALDIALHVCDALACAHQHGIIHRDIKPGNILVTNDGLVKVVDFGLAKVAQGPAALHTGTNVAMGTPGYIAPETFVAGLALDARADLYALGVMLYAMLTGRVPLGRFEAASVCIPGLDPRFDEVVNRAMQDRREARYGSASELRADLAAMLTLPGNQPATARAAAAVIPRSRFPIPSALVMRLSGVLLLTTCGVGLWLGRPWARKVGTRPAPLASPRTRPKRVLPTPADEALEDGFTNTLGMKFNHVEATNVLFCIHTTRVKDYAAYAAEMLGGVDSWRKMERDQVPLSPGDDYPATGVSWDEANEFCAWLSRKEGRTYRLPTDREWSLAVGIGLNERLANDTTPESLSEDIPDVYPWGSQWPPPPGAGNYADTCCKQAFPTLGIIGTYTDGFAATAPVMSFSPNRFGLYDMGGNIWQWCQDWYNTKHEEHVMRGGNWLSFERRCLLSSYRHHLVPDFRGQGDGFRCVLAPAAGRALTPMPSAR